MNDLSLFFHVIEKVPNAITTVSIFFTLQISFFSLYLEIINPVKFFQYAISSLEIVVGSSVYSNTYVASLRG